MRARIDAGRVALLRGTGLFDGFSDRELQRIAPLLEDARVDDGDVLMREGRPGREAYIVVEGEADVSVGGRHVATVRAGSLVGEMAMVDGGVRSATVTARSPMRLLAIGPRAFPVLLSDARIANRFLRQAVGRLRDRPAS